MMLEKVNYALLQRSTKNQCEANARIRTVRIIIHLISPRYIHTHTPSASPLAAFINSPGAQS